MTTATTHALGAIDDLVEHTLRDREARAAKHGQHYPILWQRILDASTGGKRIRPRLLLMAFEGLATTPRSTANADPITTTAAAFELLHTALLLHDDVLDGDLVRRGRANLQGAFVADALGQGSDPGTAAAWGMTAGVLAGDLLISAVHTLVASLAAPQRGRVHEIIDDCLFDTAAGELSDVALALGMQAPSITAITSMMINKTSAYSFSAPLRAGAVLAGADRETEAALEHIGHALGVVYQLRDDLLGVFGTAALTGKSDSGDLREGKQTMLIAEARGRAPWHEVEHLFGRRGTDDAELELLRAALEQSGARMRTEARLQDALERATLRIEQAALPTGLRSALTTFAHSCAERTA